MITDPLVLLSLHFSFTDMHYSWGELLYAVKMGILVSKVKYKLKVKCCDNRSSKLLLHRKTCKYSKCLYFMH